MTWKRLEGGHLDPEFTEGMSARIADPLWMLARQWQVGEFRGEDAASPVLIQGGVVAAPITEYWVERDGVRHTIPRTAHGVPLETLVEHEPIAEGPAARRLRLESGAALLRRLAGVGAPAALLDALRTSYAFTEPLDDELDPVGHARLALLVRRSIDGAAVARALDAAGGDPALLPEIAGLAEPLRGSIVSTMRAWHAQEADLFRDAAADEPRAWSARRLEYGFGVSAAVPHGVIELVAHEYPGGTLDWYHFDVRSAPDPAAGGTPQPVPGLERKSLASLPAPLEFAGMPAARWWEFEDHDVDFGDLAGGPEDLARSIIAAYAMVAGDDWFLIPCSLPAGSLAQVTSLRVLDDFGSWTNIPAAAVRDGAARVWKFFELGGDPGPARGEAPLLFLPPVVDGTEQGRPLEAVEFRRDEMANLAWAIERRVESEFGRPVDREAERGRRRDGYQPAEGAWRYRLSTDVPDHWVPLVPVRITAQDPEVVLRRGVIATQKDPRPAKGRILEPEHPFLLNEEEIPAGGLRVTRRFQLARGADGRVHLWVGRKKAPSGGPMRRTPLRFDSLVGWSGRG